MSFFTDIFSAVVTYAPVVISAAAAGAAVTPQGAPGTVWYDIRGIINLLALNVGNAKNAPTNPAATSQ